MQWQDEAVILSARPFGETSKIVELLARDHGRACGLVRGARSKAMRALLQPGNRVHATWRARLADQLGTLQLELIAARAGVAMQTPWGAFGLTSMASLLAFLPERDPHQKLYAAADALIDAFPLAAAAGEAGVRFELILLSEFGFGLDLTRCAATGAREGLVYVSPRSGSAVSAAAGAPYAERLLPLPRFLTDPAAPADAASLAEGFRMTGHFLAAHVAALAHKPLPEPRQRFVRSVLRALMRDDGAAAARIERAEAALTGRG